MTFIPIIMKFGLLFRLLKLEQHRKHGDLIGPFFWLRKESRLEYIVQGKMLFGKEGCRERTVEITESLKYREPAGKMAR
jgi:hypothetical protein